MLPQPHNVYPNDCTWSIQMYVRTFAAIERKRKNAICIYDAIQIHNVNANTFNWVFMPAYHEKGKSKILLDIRNETFTLLQLMFLEPSKLFSSKQPYILQPYPRKSHFGKASPHFHQMHESVIRILVMWNIGNGWLNDSFNKEIRYAVMQCNDNWKWREKMATFRMWGTCK